uniref:F-box domain-containing protein n=1 Tax=Steinernema glaseri TaxID=37863 RepID=A0A1I7YES0_9BILA
MDSVPFEFCLDVMGKLQKKDYHYEKMAQTITGRWKAAAQRYADNVCDFEVDLRCDEGKWSCTCIIDNDYYISLDDLLAMSRRFVRCRAINVNKELDDDDYTTCSKEVIFGRLLPLMVQQAHSHGALRFHRSLSREDARMCFDFFRSCKGFGFPDLELPYFGEESEQFLSVCLEHGLKCLTLDTSWSLSQAVENLILKYFTTRRSRWTWSRSDPSHSLKINEPEGAENEELSTLISRRILEITVNAWSEADNNFFEVYSPWYGDLGPVLSIPVPPNVTRTEYKISEEYSVRWSKRNGCILFLFWNDHRLRLTAVA